MNEMGKAGWLQKNRVGRLKQLVCACPTYSCHREFLLNPTQAT